MLINIGLFILASLIWGTTWFVIKLQLLSPVPAIWSLTYRFGIAASCMLLLCFYTKQYLPFQKRLYILLGLQGLCLYALNYLLIYIGCEHFISGLVAIIFGASSIMNLLNHRLFLKAPLQTKPLLGALLGLLGLILIFLPEMRGHSRDLSSFLLGVGCCLMATYLASVGSILWLQIQKYAPPFVPATTIALGTGFLCLLFIAIFSSAPLAFDLSVRYVSTLLYLSIFGTLISFAAYLRLVQRVGPGQAAYISVITPVIALLISTHLEQFHWQYWTWMGLSLIIFGNLLIFKKNQ